MFRAQEDITKEDILSKIPELDLWKFYVKGFKRLNKTFSSELRSDSNPSCSITYYKNRYMYRDFGEGISVDIFGYLMKKFDCNYYESLSIIGNDFGLYSNSIDKSNLGIFGIHLESPLMDINKEEVPQITIINTKVRKWNTRDGNYWYKRYGVTQNLLDKYRCFPLESYTVFKEDSRYDFTCKSITYGFWYKGDWWKIYAPLEKEYKHFHNTNQLFGLEQLPDKGDKLIICSSPKDSLTLMGLGIGGIFSIAPSSESQVPKQEIILDLQKRFNDIRVLLDNDLTGKKYSKRIHNEYPFIKELLIYEDKDISDKRERIGKEETIKIIQELL